MQVPLQITLRNIPPSDAFEARIRDKVAKLEAHGIRIVSLSVLVEAETRRQQQGRPYKVRLDIRLPGQEIVVNREADEDPYVALRDAFDAARRQVEEEAAMRRNEMKARTKTAGA